VSIPVCHYRQMLTDLIQHGTHDGELTTEQKIEAAKAYAMLRQAEADLELAEAVRAVFSRNDPRLEAAAAAVREAMSGPYTPETVERAVRDAWAGDDQRLGQLADEWKQLIAEHVR